MGYYSYNLITLTGIFGSIIFAVLILTRTEIGKLYVTNLLPLHVRGVGLVGVIGALIYVSFFIDISYLRSDAAIKKTSLENDILFIESMLPGINEEFSIVVKQYGELKGLPDTEEYKKNYG